MEADDLISLVDDLGENIDDLEEALSPLLSSALSTSTSKLPLLDKAKLYVLATYAIESILFSALRLNGVNAKTHPVFKELTRVKEYFDKIKHAETAGTKPGTRLDQAAAGRFIKHGLAGNEQLDRQRAGKRKFEGTHTRFEESGKKVRAEKIDEANIVASPRTRKQSDEGVAGEVDGETPEALKKAAKMAKRAQRDQLKRKRIAAAYAEGVVLEPRRAKKVQTDAEDRGEDGGDVEATESTPEESHESSSALPDDQEAGESRNHQ